MRLWSLHPENLDGKGLVAVWREALLAKAVLENKTKGYKNHPQLDRFRDGGINDYLSEIWKESERRNYNFNKNKIGRLENKKLTVTKEQVDYEFQHLVKKLEQRNKIKKLNRKPHPLFKVIKGKIESWEVKK